MPLEVPQLDDRNFDEILAEAIARIPVHTPEWTNFNDSDPGMTLMQLFAFMSDNLLYRSNRLPEATRLKFLSLLGIPLYPATAARGLVTFTNDRGPAQILPLESGLELYAGKVPFRTRTPVNILPISSEVFYKRPRTLSDLDSATLTNYSNLYDVEDLSALGFYQTIPFLSPQAGQQYLPEVNIGPNSTDTLDKAIWLALVAPKHIPPALAVDLIGGQTLSVGIYPAEETLRKLLETQSLGQETVRSALSFDAALLREPEDAIDPQEIRATYRRLEIESAEDVLEMPGIIQVKLPPRDDIIPYSEWGFDPIEEGVGDLPPFIEDNDLVSRIVLWIRVQLSEEYESTETLSQRGRIAWIGVNVSRVIQAIRIENERIGIGTGTPNQILKVANTPVIMEESTQAPKGQTDDYTFELQIGTLQNIETWHITDDLYAEKPEAKVFSLDPESGEVVFGDGLRGARPPRGATISVSYEYGGGIEGAVAIGAINKSALLPGGIKVSNPIKTWGASTGETVADGERRISNFLKHHDRLVTLDDFHEITKQTPGVDIGRVEIMPLFSPVNDNGEGIDNVAGVITVMVVPDHDVDQSVPPIPTRLFLHSIADWLDPRRLVTTQVYIQGPAFLEIVVSLGIKSLPGHNPFIVKNRVKKAMRRYLSPLVGGVTTTEVNGEQVGQGWQLRSRLRLEDLMAEASRVEGVRYVEDGILGLISQSGELDTVPDDGIEFNGLQLPWLSAIDVQETTPTPLDELGGVDTSTKIADGLPVPLLPKKC